MTKFLFNCLAVLFFSQLLNAQTMVFGYLKDQNGKPIELANVSLGDNQTTQTDKVGYFQFKEVLASVYTISIGKTGYVPRTFTITVSSDETKKNLGDDIRLEYNPAQAEVGMVTLTDDELSTDEGSSLGQTGIGLLQSSRDVFSRTAAFELGAYWFRTRGTDNRYSNIMFNGIPMAKAASGRPNFGNWGGLNNVVRYPYEMVEGNNVSDYSFSDLGGTTYYDTRASSYRKGLNLTYSFGNRTYQHRVMATYSTGMLPSGWAFTLSGSRRWMANGVIEGTYSDSYGYFAAIEKKFSDKNRLSFTAFGAPTRRANSSPNTQEVYDLGGKNYNAYWGWQDGERRNERVRRYFEPVFMLSDDWDLSQYTKLITTVSYQFGQDKRSRLNWYQADNPSPIYYKNLPSYLMELARRAKATDSNSDVSYFLGAYQNLYNAWTNNDESITQINWASLYNANYNAPLATDPYTGETGHRATYFLVDDVVKDKTLNAAIHLQSQLDTNVKFFLNLNYQNLVSENYREVNDLLGADFALNRSSFLKGDGTDASVDNFNLLNPNSVARKGDKIEYDYKLYSQFLTANATTRINVNRWDVAVSALLSWNGSHRFGEYQNGLYADNSYGSSKKQNFFDFGLRGTLTYKINGRNFIVLNSTYYTEAPTLNEIYVNPRLANVVTPDLTSQKINSNDITYNLRTPGFRARVTGYYTKIKDGVEVSRYYAEGLDLSDYTPAAGSVVTNIADVNTFVSEVLTGVEKDFLGVEAGFDWKIIPTLTFTGVAAVGQYTYKNNPDLYIMTDTFNGMPYFGKAYIKDYKMSGTPQKAYSAGLRYNSPDYWWFGVTGNFLQDIYSDISYLARTLNFVMESDHYAYPGANPETVHQILKPQQYQDVFMLNANIGKSFRFGKYNVGASLSVNNILNNRKYVTGAFEQGRYSNYKDLAIDKNRDEFYSSMGIQNKAYSVFGNKLFYDTGRTYFFSVYLRF
ncbi:MAG: carboxypeptidase-like regulatory domain-containing protein [Flavobacteriaceae bacterium]|jgi:hypothetical protein|nr:carboxypeptidase-like regulatory domain-containing protein [Flavobacteriaceae bacterium]